MNETEFVFPSKTKAISVTGRACSLNCAHCNKHYLGKMTPLESFGNEKDVKSILVSGGCNMDGGVPLLEFKEELVKLKEKYRIIAHTGLISAKKAKRIREIADVVSFDLPPSTNAIKEVFGIGK
ncbi:MAG: radical SAM protein, partial [Candidatus Micrarchaeota archaeon]